MRSRYAAFAKDELDYLWRTWHPRTRPEDLEPDPGLTWTGLRILDVVDGQAGDERGVVEFAATYTRAGRPGERRERSEFVRRRGRWVYESGEVDQAGGAPAMLTIQLMPNLSLT